MYECLPKKMSSIKLMQAKNNDEMLNTEQPLNCSYKPAISHIYSIAYCMLPPVLC